MIDLAHVFGRDSILAIENTVLAEVRKYPAELFLGSTIVG